jgi:formamidopyrimidine-DNA glycosylase
MPELPEVETVKRSIAPHLINKKIEDVVIRFPRLRWPIPADLLALCQDYPILSVWRRAKYVIIEFPHGAILIHLGMSGHLRLLTSWQPPEKHDHFDLILEDGNILRLRDPRRFGAILWQQGPALQHALLRSLGPEPLSEIFTTDYLAKQLHNKRSPIKIALMDSHLVVGVGNIYANEALFRAGILPQRPAQKLSLEEITRLINEIKHTLNEAIQAGGSTLRDFVNSDGRAGYFQQSYFVYQRKNQACHQCGQLIEHQVMGSRATFFCPICQI